MESRIKEGSKNNEVQLIKDYVESMENLPQDKGTSTSQKALHRAWLSAKAEEINAKRN